MKLAAGKKWKERDNWEKWEHTHFFKSQTQIDITQRLLKSITGQKGEKKGNTNHSIWMYACGIKQPFWGQMNKSDKSTEDTIITFYSWTTLHVWDPVWEFCRLQLKPSKRANIRENVHTVCFAELLKPSSFQVRTIISFKADIVIYVIIKNRSLFRLTIQILILPRGCNHIGAFWKHFADTTGLFEGFKTGQCEWCKHWLQLFTRRSLDPYSVSRTVACSGCRNAC